MQIQQIETFVNIYTTRSFAKTAEKMYLSQSRISQQLKSMESEIGLKLFERTNHRVIPTERGSVFYSYAQNILNIYQESTNHLNDLKNNFYIHTLSSNHLSPFNKAMMMLSYSHPDASYKILKPVYINGTVPYDIMAPRHIYLARSDWERDSKINYFDLGKPYFSIIMKNGNPLINNSHITLEDLSHFNAIVNIENGPNKFQGPLLGELTKSFEKYDISTKIVSSFSDLLSELISSNYNSVAIISNKISLSEDMPFKQKRLYVNNDSNIGYFYTGTATEYMLEFMNLVKKESEKMI